MRFSQVISRSNEVPVPGEIMKFLKLKKGDVVEFEIIGNQVILKKKKHEYPLKIPDPRNRP